MFVICFISQWMERPKYSLFVFPPKKTLTWRMHCSIGQSCCSMTSKRSIGWFLESSRAWTKTMRVCNHWTNQSNRSMSVRLSFLFCSCVFISRSYENRSIVRTRATFTRHGTIFAQLKNLTRRHFAYMGPFNILAMFTWNSDWCRTVEVVPCAVWA